jgi:antitoxin VapB
MDRPATAKLFRNGRSQAVRLPAKYRFEGADEVFVSKVGDKVVLSAKPSSWDDFFDAKPEGAQGFLRARKDRPPQKRRLFT